MRALLGAHSKIDLVNEPELIRGMISAGVSVSDQIKPQDYSNLLQSIKKVGVSNRHLSTLPEETLSKLSSYSEGISFREFYEHLLPKPEDAEIWGEKSLGNVFYIRELHQVYPDAIFIHIVRDPRAALLSLYRKKFAGSKDLVPTLERKSIRFFAHNAIRWKRWLDTVRESRDSLGGNAVIEVKYEDLVVEPERELRRLCENIGIGFEPEMMNASRRKKDPVITSGVYAYAHQNINRAINPDRANANEELPEWASYVVEKYVADDLKGLGFDSEKASTGILEKIRVEMELILSEKKIQFRIDKDINKRNKSILSGLN